MYKTCSECQKQFLYTTSSPQLWDWNFHVLNLQFNEQSVVILWVSWWKKKSFWQRFTCTWEQKTRFLLQKLWEKDMLSLFMDKKGNLSAHSVISFVEIKWTSTYEENHWYGSWRKKTLTMYKMWQEIGWLTGFFYKDSYRLIDVSQLSGEKFSVFITTTCVLFFCLQDNADKTWTKMPILWKNWDSLMNSFTW